MLSAPLMRRLGAILYDSLLVVALMALATLAFIAARGGESVPPGDLTYRIVLLVIAWAFFTGFWTWPGRTLGMQSWRLQIETIEGQRPGIGAASLRFFAAIVSWLPLGLGFWWQLWNSDGLTWHDQLSGTRLRYFPKTGPSEPVSTQTR